MNGKSLLITLSLLVIVLLGCNKENDPIPETAMPDCSLINWINNHISTNYHYDNNGKIVKISFQSSKTQSTWETSVEYDQLGRLSKMTDQTRYSTFEYTENSLQPTREFVFARKTPLEDFSESQTITYSYDSEGKLIKQELSSRSISIATTNYEYDEKNNLTKELVVDRQGVVVSNNEFLSYDDKKNPFQKIPFRTSVVFGSSGITEVTSYYNPIESPNNVLIFKSRNQSETYAYEYNKSGYPIKGTGITFAYSCK